MNQFCEIKDIKREFSVARTPQQNGVVERRNRIMIEAARTMVLVIKPHTKTPYELIHGRTPLIDFMKPFGSPKDSEEDFGIKPTEVDVNGASNKDGEDDQATRSEFERLLHQEKQIVHPNSTSCINTVSTPVSTAGPSFTNDAPSSPVNAASTSKEHLFDQFSPFKNAFTLLDVLNMFSMR
ncbi:ribonuclease H-like domain-containing protein [Tanacetum coccineum]